MRAPDHQLVVGTVYDPSGGSGEAHRVGLPPWPDVVGLRAGNPAQSDPRPDDRDLWYCRIIEPNTWGADAVRASFWDTLQSR